MASRGNDYRFLSIRDALSVDLLNKKVNLVGVVFAFSVPKTTKGTDCFCRLKIVDESCQSPGIWVHIFAENMEKLPRVESDGDIIQFSHVTISIFEGELFAQFNKKFSSFALFGGKYSRDFIPFQFSPRYLSRDDDKKFITGLRTWLLNFQLDAGTSNSLSLSEIKDGQSFDLVCKILHVCEVSKDKWMLFLWDGTDTPPSSIRTKLEDENENPLPLQWESVPLSRDVLCTFPTIGTVLRASVDQENVKLGLHLIGTGRWMKFLSITCTQKSGLWYGILSSTWLRYLSNEDNIVKHRQRFFDERTSLKCGSMPLSSFPSLSHITETNHEDVPIVTLMDVLTHAEVTAKFKCAVRVLATYPWRVEDFLCPNGTYRLRLTLEDPTARIHAYLGAKDGEKFFDGYPSIEVLKNKQNKLLGIIERDDDRYPPWVECCLKSYYGDKSDPWRSRRFGIFDTKVVG